jgi:hypothetical protein
MTKIIAFCGLIGSGKNTAAEYLTSDYGYVQDSFAASVKDALSVIFGWDRELLEGKTQESREWRESVDQWWASRLGIPNLTPRWAMQYWATQVCRNAFHQDIWVASLQKRLLTTNHDVVVTDARFQNELDTLRQMGATIVQVRRGSDPDWWDIAKKANQGDETSLKKLLDLNIHESEFSWAGYHLDYIIENNHDLSYLYENLDNMLIDLAQQRSRTAVSAALGNWHQI